MLAVDQSKFSVAKRVSKSLMAIAATATFIAIAGDAQAQDCAGGFRMIKDEIPIRCEAGVESMALGARALVSEPLTTGSDAAPAAGAPPPGMSPGGMKCVGGYTWRPGAENSYTTLPMACGRM
jgi:hypothetical protein